MILLLLASLVGASEDLWSDASPSDAGLPDLANRQPLADPAVAWDGPAPEDDSPEGCKSWCNVK